MVFNQYYTQSEMLMYCVAMNAKGFMDWQNGTCNFDSDEFRALLEFVKPLPAEFSWQSDEEYESDFTRMKSGKQLLYPMNLNDFDNIYYTFAALDHDIRFVGFPREDGSSGSAFTASVLCRREKLGEVQKRPQILAGICLFPQHCADAALLPLYRTDCQRVPHGCGGV